MHSETKSVVADGTDFNDPINQNSVHRLCDFMLCGVQHFRKLWWNDLFENIFFLKRLREGGRKGGGREGGGTVPP